MNPLADIWRQLVARRLWPVALLLVGALAAVPVLLAKEPQPPVAPPAAPAAAPDDGGVLAEEPIVALADEAAGAKSKRRPLGKRHDIFKPTKKPVKAKSANDTPEATAPKDDTTAGGGDAPTGGAAPAPATPVAPVPTPEPEPTKPEKTYEAGDLTIRFDGKRRAVKRLDPLPTTDEPVLIYTGTIMDGRVAEFLVGASLTAIGDGECHPSPEVCETLRLREGDIEFIDVKDETGAVVAQYELELVEIHKGSKAKAKASRARAALRAPEAGPVDAPRTELRSVAGLAAAHLP